MTLIGELVKYVMTPFVPLLRVLKGRPCGLRRAVDLVA